MGRDERGARGARGARDEGATSERGAKRGDGGGGERGREVAVGVFGDAGVRGGRLGTGAGRGAGAGARLVAVVSQPGRPRGRGRKSAEPAPSPVAELAMKRGSRRIGYRVREGEREWFLSVAGARRRLDGDGGVRKLLPQKFLDIPRYGTLNIHPSLLPQWRGAAPVQRALESGQAETGVSVAYTILKWMRVPCLDKSRDRWTETKRHQKC